MRCIAELYRELRLAKKEGFLDGLSINGIDQTIDIVFSDKFPAITLHNLNNYILTNYPIEKYYIIPTENTSLKLRLQISNLIARLAKNAPYN